MGSSTCSHSLIDAKLDEDEVVSRELLVAGCDAPALLDLNLIKKPLDQIASAIEVLGSLRFRFGGMFARAPFSRCLVEVSAVLEVIDPAVCRREAAIEDRQ